MLAALYDPGWVFAHPFLSFCTLWAGFVTYYALLWSWRIFLLPKLSPLRDVPGPECVHSIYGNMGELSMKPPGRAHVDWTEQFGGAVRYRGLLGQDLLLLSDSVAMTHLLTNDPYACYQKPAELRGDLLVHLGKGLIFAEGEEHRHQRRMLTPAFSHANVKAMLPTFFDLAHKLRGIWIQKIETGEIDSATWYYRKDLESFRASKEEGETVVEVADWLTRLTLDAIGKTGFDYEFSSLDRREDPLSTAFYTLFAPKLPMIRIPPKFLLIHHVIGSCLHALPSMSWLKHVPDARMQQILEACKTLEVESRKIITAKRDEVKRAGQDALKGKKDLISLLIAADGPDSKISLTAEELRGQLNSFLFAGHDTIAGTIAWVLLAMSNDRARQERLRREIRRARTQAIAAGREELDHDELNSLEYLDAVVRESLRLEPALSATPRTAIKDDLIPLSVPIVSATDPSKTISFVPIKKGQTIWLGVYAANRDKKVFGPDADEFRPERWLDPEHRIDSKMGVYSGLMTFLAGPRSCPGYKFALLEIKAVLSVLIDTFEFSPRDSSTIIERGTQVITRPYVKGEVHLGTRMPLRIRITDSDDAEE
ncbi:uncharacterized protein JCM15063_001855 [Sporobolomyces koalae]|uniref:uncharacterized protein n=1 Tax=Sporobolomyces koalae TaxID=500713 RepID=UPI0031753AED